MKQTISILEPGILKVDREGIEYLGFKLSTSIKPDLAAVKGERSLAESHLVQEGVYRPWKAEGMLQYEGRYLIGPFLEGRSLMRALESSPKEALRALQSVDHALLNLKKQGVDLDQIDGAGIYLLDRGGVLFLPNSLSERLRNSLKPDYRFDQFETLNHPDLSGERNQCFALATAAYRAVSSLHPFFDPQDPPEPEELHHRIRKARHVPLHLLNPKLDESQGEELSRAIAGEEDAPGLSRMAEILKTLAESLDRDTPGQAIEEERRLESERRNRKILRSRRREDFLRKYRVHIAVAALLLAVVGSVAGTIIGNLTEPPVTLGMEPRAVVELFYESINRFDHMTMEDCVTDGAGENYLREATNLFVISRMRQGYEQGRNPYIGVQEWIDAGRGPIPEEKSLYGIGNLEISARGDLEFLVSYEKWIPFSEDMPDNQSRMTYSGEQRMELVFLREEKGAFRIYRFELLEASPLDDLAPPGA